MCHHELCPTSVSHPFSSLNSSLGFAQGKHYQKITIPIFRLVLQKFPIPGCMEVIIQLHEYQWNNPEKYVYIIHINLIRNENVTTKAKQTWCTSLYYTRDDHSRNGLNQWDTTLQCNFSCKIGWAHIQNDHYAELVWNHQHTICLLIVAEWLDYNSLRWKGTNWLVKLQSI